MTGLAEVAGRSSQACFGTQRIGRCPIFALPARCRRTVAQAKKDIHPKYYSEATVVCNGEEVLTTSGTQEKYVVDVWSGNHPFYTKSENTMITDEGRVSRFNKRFDGLTMGQLSASKPGEKKLEYKTASKQKGKGKGKGKR